MSSKGVEYLNHAYYRSFSLNIFAGNTESLLQALNKLGDPMEYAKSLSSGDSESRHQVLREVSRLFHNFLAGAMTLVDHTRVFVDEFYLGTEVHKEFKARVNREFAQNPLTRFVQDLRNYMIHRGLPPLNRHLTITPVAGGEPKAAKAVTGFYLPTQGVEVRGEEVSGCCRRSDRFAAIGRELPIGNREVPHWARRPIARASQGRFGVS